MGFWLKKFTSFWLMPFPFCVSLIAVGWLLGRRQPRAGRGLIAIGLLLLLLFGNKVVSDRLLRPLEAVYPPVPEFQAGAPAPEPFRECRYVVVLGSGHADVSEWSATDKLSSAGLARVVEAFRLLRVLPDARLIVSGPADPGRPSHAAVLAAAAESLGIASSRIIRIEEAHDTEDEARIVKSIVGGARIALVTSAWHMPRAAELFRAEGVDFIPCPTDYAARFNETFHWGDLTWDVESLDRSTKAVHEFLGRLWLRLR